jgi:hypothetical protein
MSQCFAARWEIAGYTIRKMVPQGGGAGVKREYIPWHLLLGDPRNLKAHGSRRELRWASVDR